MNQPQPHLQIPNFDFLMSRQNDHEEPTNLSSDGGAELSEKSFHNDMMPKFLPQVSDEAFRDYRRHSIEDKIAAQISKIPLNPRLNTNPELRSFKTNELPTKYGLRTSKTISNRLANTQKLKEFADSYDCLSPRNKILTSFKTKGSRFKSSFQEHAPKNIAIHLPVPPKNKNFILDKLTIPTHNDKNKAAKKLKSLFQKHQKKKYDIRSIISDYAKKRNRWLMIKGNGDII